MKNNEKERENFCIKTSNLTKEERKELAEGLTDFVNEKKSECLEHRNEEEDNDEQSLAKPLNFFR